MSVSDEIRERFFNFRREWWQPAPKRVILGENKRRELIGEMVGEAGIAYRQPWQSGEKKETFMGLEILVDMGDPDRLEIE